MGVGYLLPCACRSLCLSHLEEADDSVTPPTGTLEPLELFSPVLVLIESDLSSTSKICQCLLFRIKSLTFCAISSREI